MRNKILVLGLICLFFISCTIEKKEEESATFVDSIDEIFGKPKTNEESGIVLVKHELTECMIHYHFFPIGISDYEKELCIDLAPKIKKYFESYRSIWELNILIKSPFQDIYGNLTWKPVFSAKFSRDIIEKINWNNFIKKDLLEVAENVMWFRKIE